MLKTCIKYHKTVIKVDSPGSSNRAWHKNTWRRTLEYEMEQKWEKKAQDHVMWHGLGGGLCSVKNWKQRKNKRRMHSESGLKWFGTWTSWTQVIPATVKSSSTPCSAVETANTNNAKSASKCSIHNKEKTRNELRLQSKSKKMFLVAH